MTAPRRLRVVIDARPLSHPQVGGFRSYVRSLVQGLSEVGGEDEILLYLDRPLPEDAPPLAPNMSIRILDRNRLRTDFLLFRNQVRADRPDLVHGTTNCLPPLLGLAVPTTVTVHDAMQIKRYPFMPRPKSLRAYLMGRYEATLTRISAKKARRIVTVSAASGQEIGATLKLPAERIVAVPNGILMSPPVTPVARSCDGVLALASTDLRKNFDLLLRTVAHKRGRFSIPPRLQIVCTNETSARYVEEAGQRYGVGEIQILHRLSDEALTKAYAAAAVFVWPSRLEGFGMPPLEAMRMGCAVLSSSAPAMPEILGDAPLYFDPDSPDQLAEGLETFLSNPERRAEAGRRGRAHAAQFTCRRMAEQTVAVWKEALS